LLRSRIGDEFLRINRIVFSPLNPLRFCGPNVVAEFATTVLSMGLTDVYPIIRRNNLLTGTSKLRTLWRWPFDPIRLPKSALYFGSDIYEILPVDERTWSEEDHSIGSFDYL
jgi:hypothetical protein